MHQVAEPVSRRDRALSFMVQVFGEAWASRFHMRYRLSLAEPLVFCRVCGRHADSIQHLVGLAAECKGEPPVGSTYKARLKRIRDGRHPTNDTKRLMGAVPLPFGTIGSLEPSPPHAPSR